MPEKRKGGKLPSERGRNYTPLGKWCIAPCRGVLRAADDFRSAPIITGDATLPLRWLRQLPLCGLAARNYLALQADSARQVLQNLTILFQRESV